MGRVTELTKPAAQVSDKYRFDPFGVELPGGKMSPNAYKNLNNPFGYNGEQYDPEAGLSYMRNRYYEPETGRFMNRDLLPGQVAEPLSMNAYAFVGNNPLMYEDPLGLDKSKGRTRINGKVVDNPLDILRPRVEVFVDSNEDSYVKASGKQILLGNYTNDVTVLGTGGQIFLGIFELDILGDIRDLNYDFDNWEWSWPHAGQSALDGIGLLPLIGDIKYADEVGTLIKGTGKSVSNMGEFFQDGFGKSIKNNLSKTNLQYDGQSIFKVTSKTSNEYLKKGYGVYLDALHKDHLEIIDKTGKVKYVLNLDGTINADKTAKAIGRVIKDGDKKMIDMVMHFSKIINYLENIIIENKFDNELVYMLNEQKENLNDCKNLIKEFEDELVELKTIEPIESDKTLDKLMKIHKFITDLEWHLSEISELKDEVIKICSLKRKRNTQ